MARVRRYSYWVWADLACLAVVFGPAGVAGLRRVFTPGQNQPVGLVGLCAAATLAVLVADLSGLSKAEVEWIWLPFIVALTVNQLLLTWCPAQGDAPLGAIGRPARRRNP